MLQLQCRLTEFIMFYTLHADGIAIIILAQIAESKKLDLPAEINDTNCSFYRDTA